LDHSIAELSDRLGVLRSIRRRLDQIERDTELEKPDRFEIRRKKRPRRSERVIDVWIIQIAFRIRVEDRRREAESGGLNPDRPEQCPVNRTLRQPKLIPVDPEAVVQLAGKYLAAPRASVR